MPLGGGVQIVNAAAVSNRSYWMNESYPTWTGVQGAWTVRVMNASSTDALLLRAWVVCGWQG